MRVCVRERHRKPASGVNILIFCVNLRSCVLVSTSVRVCVCAPLLSACMRRFCAEVPSGEEVQTNH